MIYRMGPLKLGDTVIYLSDINQPHPAEIVGFIGDGEDKAPKLNLIVKNTIYHACVEGKNLVEHGEGKKQWLTIKEAEARDEKAAKTKEQIDAEREAKLAEMNKALDDAVAVK